MMDAVSPRARGVLAVAACGVVAMLATAPPALADPVACGDTITESVTLEADVTGCLGTGLVVGAGGLTIDLNGHQIQSGIFNVAPGIDNSGGHDDVRIKGGRITGFSTGVVLDGADDNVLRDLEVTGNGRGVVLAASDDSRIAGSEVSGNGSGPRVGAGIVIEGGSDGNRIVDADVIGNQGDAVAILASGDNRVVDSTVTASVATAVRVADSPRTNVRGNTVSAATLAVSLTASDDSRVADNGIAANVRVSDSDDVRVARNTARQISIVGGERDIVRDNTVGPISDDGIEVSATSVAARVIGNVSNGNFGDGIDVAAPGTLIRGNTADGNSDLGILAVVGAIDGGGNTASGNGNPLQCVNVVCP